MNLLVNSIELTQNPHQALLGHEKQAFQVFLEYFKHL